MIRRRPAGSLAGRPASSADARPGEAETASERRVRAVLDLISEGVVVYDDDGATAFRNGPADRHLSARPTDALAEQALGELAQRALAGEYAERRLDLVAPTPRNLLIRAFPLSSEDGGPGAVAVVEDLSDRQRLESMRRDFVANVSHELKTPVGALSLLAETLDGEQDAEVVTRLAGRIAFEAQRLGRIIDDLLDLSRIETNEAGQTELVSVDSILSQALEPLSGLAESSGVTLEVAGAGAGAAGPARMAVPGRRADLVSAVSNLVDNAIKYSERGSLVRISVTYEPDAVKVAVSDQGVGIPARDLDRVFERFYRVDRARSRSTGGTGLGLSIVRHVAVNHGGSVAVRSTEGEGSTFTLRLPVAGLPDA
ncbi:MAG: sensor histidine kinase [Acidimicrobiales bacterium]